jgi:hypothetical protein
MTKTEIVEKELLVSPAIPDIEMWSWEYDCFTFFEVNTLEN